MKKKVLMIGLMAVMMCLAAGCQAKREEENKTTKYDMTSGTEESSVTADTVSDAGIVPDNQSMEESSVMADEVHDTGTIPENRSADENAERETVQELNGFVTNNEENRVTIMIGGEYQEGRELEDNIPGEVDVYVDDSTIYELQELSQDGEIVSSGESSLDEIQKYDSFLRVTGYWKGTAFYAEKIIKRKLAD